VKIGHAMTFFLVGLVLLAGFNSCSGAQKVVENSIAGKWMNADGNQIFEFRENGTWLVHQKSPDTSEWISLEGASIATSGTYSMKSGELKLLDAESGYAFITMKVAFDKDSISFDTGFPPGPYTRVTE